MEYLYWVGDGERERDGNGCENDNLCISGFVLCTLEFGVMSDELIVGSPGSK